MVPPMLLARWACVVGLLATSSVARADWYYPVSCVDGCGLTELTLAEYRGPFSSYESCDSHRDRESNNAFAVRKTDWAGVCEEHDETPQSARSPTWNWRSWAMQRVLVSGVGIPNTTDPTPSVGWGMTIISGRHPELSFETTVIDLYSRFDAGRSPSAVVFFGMTSSPLIARGPYVETRADAGVDLAFHGVDWTRTATFAAHAGFDFYFGTTKAYGIGIDVLAVSPYQNDTHSVMFRASMIWRNPRLWW
jgi:hypothetical protein